MPTVSAEMLAKLTEAGDKPILDSVFIDVAGCEGKAEKVQGTKGVYISSPADDWVLRGPFGEA